MPINESQKPFSKKVTQEEWNRIFKKEPRKPKKARTKKIHPLSAVVEDDDTCCGCEGCGVDCGCLCS